MATMRSRRVVLWLGVLLVMPMLFDAALSKPEDARPGASLAGQLLVDVTPLITGHVGLEGVSSAFVELANPEQHAKIVVQPWG